MSEKRTPDFRHLLHRDLTQYLMDKGVSEVDAARSANMLIDYADDLVDQFEEEEL